MKKVKILVVQTINNNLGDPIIADNNCHLLKKCFHGTEPVLLRYRINSQDFAQFRYADAVLFAGGILKSSTEKFWIYIPEIVKEADSLGLPVFFSAIGVEPFDGSKESAVLKEAVNMSCVKGISVRDDIESFKNGWLTNPDIPVYEAIDPAIWCPETYDITPSLHRMEPDSLHIGLGVLRDTIFEEYGHPEIDKQYLLDFWKKTALILENKGCSWTLFTNGSDRDERFAEEILEYIGHGDKLPAPYDDPELVKNINGFDIITAGRMHSNIIAYSLGIPCIGFIWNQKLAFWGEKTGYPERMIEPSDMTPETVTASIFRAASEGVHQITKEQYQCVLSPIRTFVEKWCSPGKGERDRFPITKKLTAFGLGSIEKKNKLTNSKEAFLYSFEHGYRNFKADIRLTSDNIPVCINKWDQSTLKTLGIYIEEKNKKFPYDEFMGHKWYDRFTPISLDELLALAENSASSGKISLILDIGKPRGDDQKNIFPAIRHIIDKHALRHVDCYLKIEQKEDVKLVNSMNFREPVLFLLPHSDSKDLSEEQKDIISFCKENKVKYLSVRAKSYNQAVKEALSKNRLKAYIISTPYVGKILEFCEEKNIAFIGSEVYEADHIMNLTR